MVDTAAFVRKKRNNPPEMFSYLPPTTIARHFTKPFGSRRQVTTRGFQARNAKGRARKTPSWQAEGNALSPPKRERLWPLLCSQIPRLPTTLTRTLHLLIDFLSPPQVCTLFSPLAPLVPLTELLSSCPLCLKSADSYWPVSQQHLSYSSCPPSQNVPFSAA